MDSIDAGPLVGREDAKKAAHQEQAVDEEGGPEAALRRWITPYAAVFKHGASVASASAALVAASGVLIAGPSFARAGVPFAKLPLLLLTAAGLHFAITTAAGLYIGLVAGFTKTRVHAFVVVGFSLVINFGWLVDHSGLSWGLLIDFMTPIAAGLLLRRVPLTHKPGASWVSVVVPVLLILSYEFSAYPSVPAAVGGGRPKPVQISWLDRPPSIPESGGTYEVFRDEGFIYIAVEPEDKTGPWARFWRRSFGPGATFVAVPVAQVRSVVYLPWIGSFDHLPASSSALAASPPHLGDDLRDGGIVEGSRTSTTALGDAADASAAGAEPGWFDGGRVSR